MVNRVQIVQRNVAPENWFYTPTSLNPAVIATRVLSPVVFCNCKLWWKSPKFLHSEPVVVTSQNFLEPVVLEEKWVEILKVAASEQIVGTGNVIECSRFGTLSKLLRVTSFVKRFVGNLKAVVGKIANSCG